MISKEYKIIFLVIIFLFILKFIMYNDYNPNEDFSYIRNTKLLLGYDVNLDLDDKQCPPLFSILLIPAVVFNFYSYQFIIGIVFSVLTFLPLYLICKRYLRMEFSIIIAFVIVMTNLSLNYGNIFKPDGLSVFLVSWFLLFFIDVDKKKNFVLSSVFFVLMISNKFIFFYMIPFIVLWFCVLNKKYFKEFIKKVFVFFLPMIIVFLLIVLVRGWVYGFSLNGMFGGYASYFKDPFLAIYVDVVPLKFGSVFSNKFVALTITYNVYFLAGLLFFKREHVRLFFKRRDRLFYFGLVYNFFVFLFIPCMAWKYDYLIYRYLLYVTPFCLALAFCVFLNVILDKNKSNVKNVS